MSPAEVSSIVAGNLQRVQQRVEAACLRAGRERPPVLVAVTKYAHLDWVRHLAELGMCELAESRPQQLVRRVPLVTKNVRWHLVGHLQRNKVRKLLPLVACIHSVDTWKLLARIDDLAVELSLEPRVLLEVNVSGESVKDGFDPGELVAGWAQVSACRRVEVAGLMTMAPYNDDPEAARPVFRELRALRDRLAADSSATPLPELSMGMSHDFEPAIEEGATTIRIGSALFEGL